MSSATKPLSSTSTTTGTVTGSKESAMLPPRDPTPPKAILEPELDALAICLRNAAVKTSQVHAFFADTKRLGINNFVARPPHTLTDALCREIEKFDQICDLMEAQLSRAVAVLQRDLDHTRAQEQAEREAEALRNLPPPEPEVIPENYNLGPSVGSPSSAVPMDLSARRQSTISLSSLSRPQFPHKLDLSSINPGEIVQGLGGSLPSPVTLAPKSGRTTATSEFPPSFMAALAASEIARPVDIDLTVLPEEGRTTVHVNLDTELGSSADRPIELDLEGMVDGIVERMEIDMDVPLFGDEPTDISSANPFDSTATVTGDNQPSAASLLEAFHRGVEQASVTELPFDMAMGEIDNIDLFPLDPMMNPSDMGMMDALLGMGTETGAQADGQDLDGAADT
ncbi:hypothetical protein F5148DRAFT_973778 [Russula earlei]|uniref:Uncharacterized protein n=1 Tax=Russula earlei TaxID=71964 RepID=A0ACC0UN63_9AGAM|nr:hypothetical protein F5148DRAFT_973778 [Russula earlei]